MALPTRIYCTTSSPFPLARVLGVILVTYLFFRPHIQSLPNSYILTKYTPLLNQWHFKAADLLLLLK